MAVNRTRSPNDELGQGMVDHTYKSLRPDAGGVVEPTTARSRADLSPWRYDIAERHPKVAPDGSLVP